LSPFFSLLSPYSSSCSSALLHLHSLFSPPPHPLSLKVLFLLYTSFNFSLYYFLRFSFSFSSLLSPGLFILFFFAFSSLPHRFGRSI
jgi:hypothetical protein